MKLSLYFPKLFKFWSNYWFQPASLFNLAVCRLIIVGFQLIFLLQSNHYLQKLQETHELPNSLYQPLLIFQAIFLPFGFNFRPSAWLMTLVFGLTIITGICSFFGFKTRLNLILFALGNLIIQGYLYSFGDYHHPEALTIITLFLLALSPSGKLLSIDYLLYRQSTKNQLNKKQINILEIQHFFARWSLLLVKWLLALVYLDAAMSKLKDAGLSWMNGYTLRYYLLQDGLRWHSDLGVWLAQHHEIAIVSSVMAVLFELTFFLTLIYPPLALWYVPLGTAFHIGIYLAQKAPFFHYIVLYCVFVPWSSIIKNLGQKNYFLNKLLRI